MKKSLKKFAALAMTLALAATCFTGCGKSKDATPVTVNIGVMTGPTGIGLVKVMEDDDNQTALNDYNFQIFPEATEITTGLIKGELDVACVPCNLASVLYNKPDIDVVVAAINTLGVLYIVESGDSIHSVADLKGKTVYTTGQGTTPEYTLRYLLASNGMDASKDIFLEFKSEAAEIVSALADNPDAVAMLPQPYVTIAMNNNENLRVALDVTAEWENSDDSSTVVTGVLVARKEWVDKNEKAFKNLLEEYPDSVKYVNENVEDAANLVEKFGIFKAAVAKKAIPYCHITYIDGQRMKSLISAYLTVLYNQNPASVGGKLPGDDFYYINK